jgi:hypothetical protein
MQNQEKFFGRRDWCVKKCNKIARSVPPIVKILGMSAGGGKKQEGDVSTSPDCDTLRQLGMKAEFLLRKQEITEGVKLSGCGT